MKIIGIHDGHDASVALMVDGKIIFAAQEERFSRLKGDYGFPKRAVEEMFKFSGLKPSEIDLVTVGSDQNEDLGLRVYLNNSNYITQFTYF